MTGQMDGARVGVQGGGGARKEVGVDMKKKAKSAHLVEAAAASVVAAAAAAVS